MPELIATKTIKINNEFKPSRHLKNLYYIYALGIFAICLLPWYVPLMVLASGTETFFIVNVTVLIPSVLVLVFVLFWIPLYYANLWYRLSENEIVQRGGVWFRRTRLVPYNRITNIDVRQGPISRMLGIASIDAQTAGYSVASGTPSEMKISGMENFDEVKETIMGFVRSRGPRAVETFEGRQSARAKGRDVESVDLKILSELSSIRRLLEKRSR